MEDFKIGDFVKVTKPNHICFENIGNVLKVNKNTVIIRVFDCDESNITINKKFITINKKFIELQHPKSLEYITIPSKGKNKGLDYYMKKAFSNKEDFKEILLFNFMRPEFIYKKKTFTSKDLLNMKVKKKEIVSSKFNPCIYFTPVPKKFTSKYFSKELIEIYGSDIYDDKNVFICLDSKIFCNLPKRYWIGFNVYWSYGPGSLTEHGNNEFFFAVDSCKTKLSLSENFFNFFMKNIMENLQNSELKNLENDNGLIMELEDEEKFINFLRRKIFDSFMKSEIFVCSKEWLEMENIKLKFKKDDILIANYEKNTVEENIMRVLED